MHNLISFVVYYHIYMYAYLVLYWYTAHMQDYTQTVHRPSRERSMFPKMDMAKEKEDLEKWQTETTESITNTIMAESTSKRDTTAKKWQSESSENVTNAMMTGSSSNKTVEVAVPASENIGPASGVIDNQAVAEARDMAVEDTNRLV